MTGASDGWAAPGGGFQPSDDPRLRIRIYVEGIVADELWVGREDEQMFVDSASASSAGEQLGGDLATTHRAIADRAQAEGKLWMVEVFDPGSPPSRRYLRFGTDRRMMTAPIETIHLPGDRPRG